MTRWFSSQFSPAAMNFVCLPQAGADTALFAKWANGLGPCCKIIRALLPGRGVRFDDPIPETLEELADELFAAFQKIDLAPFTIVGSSIGGCLGYELCRRIEQSKLPRPRALVVIVANPPACRSPLPDLDTLSPDQAARALVKFNPALDPLIADRELLECLLPKIRADFLMCRRYRPAFIERLSIPIIAFAGEHDSIAVPANVYEWHNYTSAEFKFICLPGDHSLIGNPPQALLSALDNLAGAACC